MSRVVSVKEIREARLSRTGELWLIVPGKPIAQNRPRFARRGEHVATYSDQKQKKDLTVLLLKMQIAGIKDRMPLEGPLELEMTFAFAVPKGDSKKKRAAKESGTVKHAIKPDLDNLEKFYLDCMNGIVFKDDAQVWKLTGKKVYSARPRVEIVVYESVRH